MRDQIEAHASGDGLRARLSHNYWATEAAVRASAEVCLEAARRPDDAAAHAHIAARAADALAAERPPARHEELRDAPPAPTHACARCGALRHTAKDARLHCRLRTAYGGGAT